MLLFPSSNVLLRLVQALRTLLKAGADVQTASRSHQGLTALHFAAIFGYAEVADVLVEHGANTATCHVYGDTAARMASTFGHDMLSAALTPAEVSTINTSAYR